VPLPFVRFSDADPEELGAPFQIEGVYLQTHKPYAEQQM
jgi:hypothetical protein